MGLDIGIYKCIVLFSVCLLVRNKLSKKCNRTVCIFWYISHFRDKSILIREKKTLHVSSSISYVLLICFQASITSWWTKKFQRTSKERCLAVLLMWHITHHQLTWKRLRVRLATFGLVLDHVIRYSLFGAYNSFVQISAYLLVTESVRCAC